MLNWVPVCSSCLARNLQCSVHQTWSNPIQIFVFPIMCCVILLDHRNPCHPWNRWGSIFAQLCMPDAYAHRFYPQAGAVLPPCYAKCPQAFSARKRTWRFFSSASGSQNRGWGNLVRNPCNLLPSFLGNW